MKTKTPNILSHNRNILLIALATAFLLLLPLVAMQFTDQVAWGAADFVVAAALLFGTGLAYELIARKAPNTAYRAAIGGALATALLLVWTNLAVGVIGSEDNPANLMYLGVLAVLVAGALLAQFRPAGMARVLFATALAQALVAVIALVARLDPDALESVMVNGFFVALWAASAWLFRRASAT